MLVSILNFILYITFAYLVLYGIYFLNINIKAFHAKGYIKDKEESLNIDFKNHKICVIVFANSKTKKLEPLLKALNTQSYSKENYSVQVIYAKDSNSILYTPDCIAGAQVHNIENEVYFSKDMAINLFVEKLLLAEKFDAFTFLGAERYVNSDFLQNINLELNRYKYSCVLTGKSTVFAEKSDSLKDKSIASRQEYKNKTVNIVRTMFDLISTVDSDNCTIPSDILEKTGKVSFETREDELKYTLFLASNGIKTVYSPFIETFISAKDFNPAGASIGTKIGFFKYYFALMLKKPLYFIEFIISLIFPNVVVFSLLYITLLYCSFKFISTISMKYIFDLGIFYLVIWFIGVIASKMSPVKIMFFLLYPLYSFIFNIKKISTDFSKRAMARAINEEKNINSATLDAVVTDGHKNVMCKMDLMTEDGMRRVILRFRKKRVISDESIRMYDAVENISKRVKTHGFTLKICQNCKNFKITQDGTLDLLKGVCTINGENPDDTLDTLIWNHCECFTLKDECNVIKDLNDKKD